MRVYIEEERKWMLLGTINISGSAGGAKKSSSLVDVCREGVSLLFAAINAYI